MESFKTASVFHMFRTTVLVLFLSTFLLGKECDASTPHSNIFIYVGDLPEDFSSFDGYKTVALKLPMLKEAALDEAIFSVQDQIRNEIIRALSQKKIPQIVLYAKGFNATLVAIAQTNLLTHYRQYISGVILEDALIEVPLKCLPENGEKICTLLKQFKKSVGSKAAFIEMSKALSPKLQIDWYWPKVLLLSQHNAKAYYAVWSEVLCENGIAFDWLNLESLIPSKIEVKREEKIQTFLRTLRTPMLDERSPLPSYFGSILRFHLGKILYRSKNQLQLLENIAYGKSNEQRYDVYFQENASFNPLFIYVHGGGWNQGDRKSFSALAQQYADRGYTAISIDYRLHHLPQVGMKEMIADITEAIEHIFQHAHQYHADSTRTVIMAESAGAQLAFMGIRFLSSSSMKNIKALIVNSITSDLRQHALKKQIRLSGIVSEDKRQPWLNRYSPLQQLRDVSVPILGLHALADRVVPSLHLDKLLLNARKQHKEITPLWVSHGVHPLAPDKKSLHPSYQEIEKSIDNFLKKHLKIKKSIKG